jgi:hypothetical protein
MQVDVLIEVTVKMNLKQARAVRDSIGRDVQGNADSRQVYHHLNAALEGNK